MQVRTYLEKLKPVLYGMSLDYSVVPKCGLETQIYTQANAESNIGKDADANAQIDVIQNIARTEHNGGKDAKGLNVQLSETTLATTAQGNVGKDAEIGDVELDIITRCLSAEKVFGHEINDILASFFAEPQVTTVTRQGVETQGNARVEFAPNATPTVSAAKDATAEVSAQFVFAIALNVLEEKLKEIQGIETAIEYALDIVAEVPILKELILEQTIESELSAIFQRVNGKRATPHITQSVETNITIQRYRHATMNDLKGVGIKTFFGEKTVNRACIIPAQ